MNFEGSHWGDCWRSHHECAIAEVERLRAELEAAKAELAKIHKHWRKPTHGPCCTCQRCGQDYDVCRCSLDDVADELETAKQRIAELENARQEWRSRLGLKSADDVVVENERLTKRVSELENRLELANVALANAAKDTNTYGTSTGNTDAPS